MHASPPTTPCAAHSLVPHSPSKSPCKSPSPNHWFLRFKIKFLFFRLQLWVRKCLRECIRFQQLKLIRIRIRLRRWVWYRFPREIPSTCRGQWLWWLGVQSCSASPEVVPVGEGEEDAADDEEEEGSSDDEETLSQGMVSLLDISNSNNEETHKAAVCKKVHKSNVLYTAWWDEQIHQGNDDIAKHNKRVHDHADVGKCCKAPDKIGPPLTYMEERGVFKPLDTIDNPMGLCRFYQMSSKKSNVLIGLKSTDSTCKIQDMIKLAKGVGRLLTVVVFEGETVTLHWPFYKSYICTLNPLSHHNPHTWKSEGGTKELCVLLPNLCVCGQKRLLVSESHHC